jgi:hypothetical protein
MPEPKVETRPAVSDLCVPTTIFTASTNGCSGA